MFSEILFDYLKNYVSESGDDFGSLDVVRDFYEIKTEKESKMYGKPKGKYELIGIPDILTLGKLEIDKCVSVVSSAISGMLGDITTDDRVLVVGLGNRHISSDSLGAKVVGCVNITIENKLLPKVMAIAPSVMGLTGIETVDIVSGVVDKVHPTHVILIDSLCASSVERLGRSIQITNTGICPGGGIGNKRKCIGDNLASKVVTIGVPLLIYASTFVRETLRKNGVEIDNVNSIMRSIKKSPNKENIVSLFDGVKSAIDDDVEGLIVSIKDIEEFVQLLSEIIGKAINRSLGVEEYY